MDKRSGQITVKIASTESGLHGALVSVTRAADSQLSMQKQRRKTEACHAQWDRGCRKNVAEGTLQETNMQSLNLILVVLALAGTSSGCKYFCKSPVTQEYECCDDGNPYYNPEEDEGVAAEVVPVDLPAEIPAGPSSNCFYYCAYEGEVYCCGDVSRPSEYNDSDYEPLSPTNTTSHDPPDSSPPPPPILSLTDATRPRPSPSSDQRFSPGLASHSQSDPLLNGTLDSKIFSSSSADSRNSLLTLSLVQKMDRSGTPSLSSTHNYLRLPLHLLKNPALAKGHNAHPVQPTAKPTAWSPPFSEATPIRVKTKQTTESSSFIAPFTNIFSFMNFTMDIPDILAGFGIGTGTTTPAPAPSKPPEANPNEKMVDVALRLSTIGREDTAVYIHKNEKDSWIPILTSVPTDSSASFTSALDLDHLPPGTIISVHKPSELMDALTSGTSFSHKPLQDFGNPEKLSIFSDTSSSGSELSHGQIHSKSHSPIYYPTHVPEFSYVPPGALQDSLENEASKVSYHVPPESTLNVSPILPVQEPSGSPIGSSYSSFAGPSHVGSSYSPPHPSPVPTPHFPSAYNPSSFGGPAEAPPYSPIFPASDQELPHFRKPSIIAEVPPLEMVPPPMEPPSVNMVPPPPSRYTPEIDLTEDEVNELIDSVFCHCEPEDPCDCQELNDLILVFPPKPMEPYVFLPLDSLSSPSLSNRLPSLTKPISHHSKTLPEASIHSPQHHSQVYPTGPSVHPYSGTISKQYHPAQQPAPVYKPREPTHPPAPVYKQVETAYQPAPVYKHAAPTHVPAPVYQHKAPSHQQAPTFPHAALPNHQPAPVHFPGVPISPTAFSVTGPLSFETDAFTLEVTSGEGGSKEFTSQELQSNSVEYPSSFETPELSHLLNLRGSAASLHPGHRLPSHFANHGSQSFVAKRESQPSQDTRSYPPQYPASYSLDSSPSQAIAFRSHPQSNSFYHRPAKPPQAVSPPKASPQPSSFHRPQVKSKQPEPQPQSPPQKDAQLFSIQTVPLDSFHQIVAPQYFHEKPVIQIMPETPPPKTFQVTTPTPPSTTPAPQRERRPGPRIIPQRHQSYTAAMLEALARNHALSTHSKVPSSGLRNKLSIAQLLSSAAHHSSASRVTSDYSNIAIANQRPPSPSSTPAPTPTSPNKDVANHSRNTPAPSPLPSSPSSSSSSSPTLHHLRRPTPRPGSRSPPTADKEIIRKIPSPPSSLPSQSASSSSPSSSSPSSSKSSSGSTPRLPSPSPSPLPPSLQPSLTVQSYSVSASVSSSASPHVQSYHSSSLSYPPSRSSSASSSYSPSSQSSPSVHSHSRATKSSPISPSRALDSSLSPLRKSTGTSTTPSISTTPSLSPSSPQPPSSSSSPPSSSSSSSSSSPSKSSSSPSKSSSPPQLTKSSPSSPPKPSSLSSKLKLASVSPSPSSSLSSSSSLPSSSSS
ncbi:proline-rich protein 36-like [Penaeus japonicus]|uniref:proline-rich protein 36-like n=1 Tax=Penaeus japonicus TaxID=27405 RepID=UPI001C7114A7|nr:proline-rich protein 36-like [Penaeus japonicus]